MALPPGFELEQAAPPQPPAGMKLPPGFQIETGGVPGPRRSWSDVPGEALANVGPSAASFYKGLVTAITSPVQTAKGVLDVGAGALQNVLPKQLVDLVNQIDNNPEAAKRAVDAANAVGGMFKDRYGSVEALKNTLATDPVGAASDLSTLFTGGASATARVAPAVSKVMGTVGKYTNPLAPVTAAVGYGTALGAKGAGNVIDAITGDRAANRAGTIVRNALTEEGRTPQNLQEALNALRTATPDMTVRQALADVTSPQVQYLGETVQAKTAPGRTLSVQQAQEADRLARLQGITPNLQAAETARTNLSKPFYNAATLPLTPINTAPLAQQLDTILAANPGNAKLIAALNQVKTGLEASSSAQQVSSVLDNLKDLISSKDNKFIVKNLVDVKKTIEQALPGYERAQQVFALASPPVNQAKVLGAMTNVLEQPLGVGERAGPFMNALGRGESALLKKATGEARYSDLSQVLSPQQMNVVKGVESELKRNAEVVSQTQKGADAMKIIMDANQSKFRLPSFLDVKVTLTNQVLDILKGKMSADVLKELEKGFASADNFKDLLGKVPASQRIDVLRALGQAQNQLSPTKLNIITQTQNALAPTQENQNALTQFPKVEARGFGAD
jgi:superoxide dismutase